MIAVCKFDRVQTGLITGWINNFFVRPVAALVAGPAILHQRFISRADDLMNDIHPAEVGVWISDGKPLKPIIPTAIKKKLDCPHDRIYRAIQNNKKRKRERWLDRVHKQELPPNHVNDKRNYYRREYLKSEHWRELKRRKLNAQPFCEECGTNRTLDVHHLSYRNLYDVGLNDLQVLCRFCHCKEHGLVSGLKPFQAPDGIECPF